MPGTMSPLLPCQWMVHPPAWLPMSSALFPATKMLGVLFASGSSTPSFFRSTSDSRTARRASARCAADPTPAVKLRSVNGRSNSAELELHREDPRHRVVDARHRHAAGVHLVAQGRDEPPVIVGDHHHVDARVRRGPAPRTGSRSRRRRFRPSPTRRPRRTRARPSARRSRGAGCACIAHAVRRCCARSSSTRRRPGSPRRTAACGSRAARRRRSGRRRTPRRRSCRRRDPVLRRREDRGRRGARASRPAVPVTYVLTDAAISGSSPKLSYVRPQRSSRATETDGAKFQRTPVARQLLRRRAGDLLDELRVARRAEADVVREERRAVEVAVTVHGVGAVQDRDREPGCECRALVAVDHVRPADRRVRVGLRAAAADHRAERVRCDVRVRREEAPVDLRHLPDLLVERHPREEVGDACGDRRRNGRRWSGRRWSGRRWSGRHALRGARARGLVAAREQQGCADERRTKGRTAWRDAPGAIHAHALECARCRRPRPASVRPAGGRCTAGQAHATAARQRRPSARQSAVLLLDTRSDARGASPSRRSIRRRAQGVAREQAPSHTTYPLRRIVRREIAQRLQPSPHAALHPARDSADHDDAGSSHRQAEGPMASSSPRRFYPCRSLLRRPFLDRPRFKFHRPRIRGK